MRSNLRKNALQTCEDWNAFFARLKIEFLSVDFQLLINRWAVEGRCGFRLPSGKGVCRFPLSAFYKLDSFQEFGLFVHSCVKFMIFFIFSA